MKTTSALVFLVIVVSCTAQNFGLNGANVLNQQQLQDQHDILQLLENVHQQNQNQHQANIGRNFASNFNPNRFQNPREAEQYMRAFQQGELQQRGAAFSVLNNNQLNQAVQLFDLFYFANDFNTFYQAACFARDNINEGQFVYAFYTAIVQRPDTKHLSLPAISEVYPQLFVKATVIKQAQDAAAQGQHNFYAKMHHAGHQRECQNENNIVADCNDNENVMSYMREDVALNENHFYQHIHLPFWMNSEKYNKNNNNNNGQSSAMEYYFYGNNMNNMNMNNMNNNNNWNNMNMNNWNNMNNNWNNMNRNNMNNMNNWNNMNNNWNNMNRNNWNNMNRNNMNNMNNWNNMNNNWNNMNNNYNNGFSFRGEILYTYLQQTVARYNLERMSNGLPQVQQIEYDQPIQPGFNPELQYENGQAVPNRPANIRIKTKQANNNNNENNNVGNSFVETIKMHEQRIMEAIDLNAIKDPMGSSKPINPFYATNTLTNCIESNADCPNTQYYGSFFTELLKLVGSASDANRKLGLAPSALENYQTMLRDPTFYMIAKRVINNVNHYKNVNLRPYSNREMRFNGVQVESFVVSPLMTYKEYGRVNIHNAVNNRHMNNMNMMDLNMNNMNMMDSNMNNMNMMNPNMNNMNMMNPNMNNMNMMNPNMNNMNMMNPNMNNMNMMNPNMNNMNMMNPNMNNMNTMNPNMNNMNMMNPNMNNMNMMNPNMNDMNMMNPNMNMNRQMNNMMNNGQSHAMDYYFYGNNMNNMNNWNNMNRHMNMNPNMNMGMNNMNMGMNNMNMGMNNMNIGMNNMNMDMNTMNNRNYKAFQHRLNHKSFNYRVVVNSNQNQPAIVRVFIGPKFNQNGKPLNAEQQRQNMVLLDKFATQLQSGRNQIVRNSHEFTEASDEAPTAAQIYNRIRQAMNGNQPFLYNLNKMNNNAPCGIPRRFQLPKGSREGLQYVMYVIVSPQLDNQHNIVSFETHCGNQQYFDLRSNLFPFDRPFREQNEFNTPNVNQHNALQKYLCARNFNNNDNYVNNMCRNVNQNNLPIMRQEDIYQPNSAVLDVVIFHRDDNNINNMDHNTMDSINQKNSMIEMNQHNMNNWNNMNNMNDHWNNMNTNNNWDNMNMMDNNMNMMDNNMNRMNKMNRINNMNMMDNNMNRMNNMNNNMNMMDNNENRMNNMNMMDNNMNRMNTMNRMDNMNNVNRMNNMNNMNMMHNNMNRMNNMNNNMNMMGNNMNRMNNMNNMNGMDSMNNVNRMNNMNNKMNMMDNNMNRMNNMNGMDNMNNMNGMDNMNNMNGMNNMNNMNGMDNMNNMNRMNNMNNMNGMDNMNNMNRMDMNMKMNPSMELNNMNPDVNNMNPDMNVNNMNQNMMVMEQNTHDSVDNIDNNKDQTLNDVNRMDMVEQNNEDNMPASAINNYMKNNKYFKVMMKLKNRK
ncbi:hypothetical protein M8J75_002609 [Diaphorina citri]|nr:hypothetical protein M8J75_002609 [Diaphorina citri]